MTRIILVNACFFVILWIVIFLFEYFFVMNKKSSNKKSKKKSNIQILEYNYLIGKFKLDENKIVYKSLARGCSLINGFIISAVVTVISNIDLYIVWQLLIGFVLLFALIYSVYEIYGRILVRKGWRKKDE